MCIMYTEPLHIPVYAVSTRDVANRTQRTVPKRVLAAAGNAERHERHQRRYT